MAAAPSERNLAVPPETSPTKTESSKLVERGGPDNGGVTCCAMDKRLFFNKLFYLSFFGALGCVLPYWAIYFKQMGFSPQQIGVIFGLRPIAGFISAPLWGMLADRFQVRRVIFLTSIFAWIAMIVTLGMLPMPERAESCPQKLEPHRNAWSLRRKTREDSQGESRQTTVVSPSLHLSKHEVEVLRENISWVYDDDSLTALLIIVALLVLGGEFVQSPTGAFADASTLNTLGVEGVNRYGAQRAWGAIGWGISSFVAGALLSRSRHPEVICGIELYFSDYRNFVYVFLAAATLGVLAATQIKFDEDTGSKKDKPTQKTDYDTDSSAVTSGSFEPADQATGSSATQPSKHRRHSFWAALRIFANLHYGTWLFTVLFAGMCNGCIWGFLFWHLENLGADQLLMGVAGMVTNTSEFIMFFVADLILSKIGHIRVFYIGFLCYIIRLVCYANLSDPWWVVPVEVLQGWTFSCMLTSMATYAAQAAPYAAIATMQGIFHGIYFGVGVGSGKLIAGLLIGSYGAVFTFYAFAASCAVVLVTFTFVQTFSPKPETHRFFYQEMKEMEDEKKRAGD